MYLRRKIDDFLAEWKQNPMLKPVSKAARTII